MKPSRRSPDELLAEIQRLALRPETERDRLALLHELQVHQEEIAVQTAELTRTQHVLEETRDRLIELYDFAPNGYLTLTTQGIVVEVNLTGASMLGRHREAIVGLPMVGFVKRSDRKAFLDFLRRQWRPAAGRLSIEATLAVDGMRQVELLSAVRPKSRARGQELFMAMIDITDRKELEARREFLASERARLVRELISVQEEERRRIARDLHDDLGQQITAMRLKLDAIEGVLADDDRVHDRLQELRRTIEGIDRRLDYLVGELRPNVLDLGLVSALQQFVADWGESCQVNAEFSSIGLEGRTLPPEVETHLYRITQEALNNACKHGEASHITVLIDGRGGALRLVVEDDGKGFDTAERAGGVGLVGMRERAALIGATLDIETAPGRGTTVYVTLPRG